MQLHEVIIRPLITEKNTALQPQNKYAFEVAKVANKPQIKEAVEKAFKVNVTSVNVVKMPSKSKRVGRRIVQVAPWKKAVITLKPGDKIQIFEGV